MKSKTKTPPSWLKNNQAKELFKRLARRIKPDEVESLAMLCNCWQDYLSAVDQVDEHGLLVVSSTGNLRKNPAYDIGKTSLENFCRIAKLLKLYDEVKEEIQSTLDKMIR
jgi:P27 family predicted phage terminase small subunit